MRFVKYLLCVFFAVFIAACGGGGGDPGTPTNGCGSQCPSDGSSGGTGGTGGTGSSVSVVNVGIFDSTGKAVTSISVGGAYTARATVLAASGAPVISTVVTFKIAGPGIAVLSPTTALTNSSGVAEVSISPASISSIGAATLEAVATVSGAAVTGSLDFSVQASSLSLASMTVGSASLPSGGNTSVQVLATLAGVPLTGVPVNVSFSVSCGRINGSDTSAGGVSVTTNGSGIASATYDSVTSSGALCSGNVSIVASSAGATPQQTSLTVAAPSANAVVFVSATPGQIFVVGSGAVEQSLAKFRVLSSAGTAMPNVPVKFSIVTNPGGVGLGVAGSTGPVTATTSASGEASISVFSGTIPGPVKVRAELLSNSNIFAESQNLTVASGPPSQRFMSLSVETFNIEGWGIDGTSTQLTVRVADRQGNAVEDGTVVNFTAEGGQVARSCSTTRISGISQCSVSFQSQNPRPAGGRVSVLAYLEGTKDYVDVNGNNRYDAGVDTLINIGDAYRDDNENGTYDASNGEFLIPRNGSVICPGAGEPFPSRVNTCDNNLSTTVRQQAVILFSSSNPALTLQAASATGIAFSLSSLQNPLLPLPAGTSLSAEALDVNSSDGLTCTVVGSVAGSPISNVNPTTDPTADLATSHQISLKDCSPGDQVKLNVRVPSGLTTLFQFTVP